MGEVMKSASSEKPRKPGLFCGVAIDMRKRLHLLLFFFFLLITACLCFSQFGIMAVEPGSANGLNIVVFLIPAALAVVLLGAVPGVAIAFVAGLLIMLRAWWTPIVTYDFQMSDPFLSVLGATLSAILMALIVVIICS